MGEAENLQPQLLNERYYFLNKSKSKFVSCGLSKDLKTTIVIGGKGQNIILNEDQWLQFLNNEGVITNFFYTKNPDWSPLEINQTIIYYTTINNVRIIKFFSTFNKCEVFLAENSLLELFKFQKIVNCNIDCLNNLKFKQFYKTILQNVCYMNGSSTTNMENSIASLTPQENVLTLKQLLHHYPEKIEEDIRKIKNVDAI